MTSIRKGVAAAMYVHRSRRMSSIASPGSHRCCITMLPPMVRAMRSAWVNPTAWPSGEAPRIRSCAFSP